jgi:hypothetical protein
LLDVATCDARSGTLCIPGGESMRFGDITLKCRRRRASLFATRHRGRRTGRSSESGQARIEFVKAQMLNRRLDQCGRRASGSTVI